VLASIGHIHDGTDSSQGAIVGLDEVQLLTQVDANRVGDTVVEILGQRGRVEEAIEIGRVVVDDDFLIGREAPVDPFEQRLRVRLERRVIAARIAKNRG
jgi:hypothetical protein